MAKKSVLGTLLTVGAVAAEAGYYGGPLAAAAASAATSALLNVGESMYTGNSITGTEIVTNALVDFSSTLVAGGVIPAASVPGRNSITALSKQILTKLKNGTIHDAETITKIKTLIGKLYGDLPADVVDAIFNELLGKLQITE